MGKESAVWVREDHTKAKHELLVGFFNKWVSVHSEFFASRGGGLVRIYDGFAGPGVYAGGEPGSPRILMETLIDNPNLIARWMPVRYAFTFVEQDAERARMLEEGLSTFETTSRTAGRWTDRITWSVTRGRYEDHVPPTVTERSALFLFLDPFGYSHAPMTLTHDLVQQPKSDTLIFLPLSFVNRFVGREGQERALDRFFGTPLWRDIPDGPARPQALLQLFRAQLTKAGLTYTLPFRLKPPDGSNEYWIVGGSSNLRGLASIKEGFWTVDPVHGEGFAAPRSAPLGQDALFGDMPSVEPDTGPLLGLLRERFGHEWFSIEDAMSVTERSHFLDRHLKQRTLVPAEKAEVFDVNRPADARRFKEGKGIMLRFR
jgi:three-Cys-motif partner protein